MVSQIILAACILLHLLACYKILVGKQYGIFALVFVVYHLLFFLIPGYIHADRNLFPFFGFSYSRQTILTGSIIVFLYSAFFFFGFFFSKRKIKKAYPWVIPKLRPQRAFIAISVCLVIELTTIGIIGLDRLLVKRSDFANDSFSSLSFVALFFLFTSRALSFCNLLVSVNLFLQVKRPAYFFLLGISAAFFFVINFPLSLPRFVLFGYILAFVYIFFGGGTGVKRILFVGFVGGITTIFPIISLLTRVESYSLDFSLYDYYANSVDFDGFQSLLNVVDYVDSQSIRWGQQLLGAIFILVPRAIWSSKPAATGELAAGFVGYDFLNISSPLVSELYIDFGFIGITLLSIVVGYFYRKLDYMSLIAPRLTATKVYMLGVIFSLMMITLRGSLIGIAGNLMIHLFVAAVLARYVSARLPKVRLTTSDESPRTSSSS